MSLTDPIADMLTCIRNAIRAGHRRVDVKASNQSAAILEALLRERYLQNFKRIEDGKQGVLRVYLKYVEGTDSVITDIKRVSKPGRRVYVNKEKVPTVMGGMGSAIISTTKGILTDKEARAAGLGGEVLAKVW